MIFQYHVVAKTLGRKHDVGLYTFSTENGLQLTNVQHDRKSMEKFMRDHLYWSENDKPTEYILKVGSSEFKLDLAKDFVGQATLDLRAPLKLRNVELDIFHLGPHSEIKILDNTGNSCLDCKFTSEVKIVPTITRGGRPPKYGSTWLFILILYTLISVYAAMPKKT